MLLTAFPVRRRNPYHKPAATRILSGSRGIAVLGLCVFLVTSGLRGEQKRTILLLPVSSDETISPPYLRKVVQMMNIEFTRVLGSKHSIFTKEDISELERQLVDSSIAANNPDAIDQLVSQLRRAKVADIVVRGQASRDSRTGKHEIFFRVYARNRSVDTFKISFFDNQLVYFMSESAKRTIDPAYTINVSAAPPGSSDQLTIERIELTSLQDLPPIPELPPAASSQASDLITDNEETIEQGDRFAADKEYDDALKHYNAVIAAVGSLSSDTRNELTAYEESVWARIRNIHSLKYKIRIESIDRAVKGSEDIGRLENAMGEYAALLKEFEDKVPTRAQDSVMKNGFKQRLSAVAVFIFRLAERNADMLYSQLRFSESEKQYLVLIERIERNKEPTYGELLSRLQKKLGVVRESAAQYNANRMAHYLLMLERAGQTAVREHSLGNSDRKIDAFKQMAYAHDSARELLAGVSEEEQYRLKWKLLDSRAERCRHPVLSESPLCLRTEKELEAEAAQTPWGAYWGRMTLRDAIRACRAKNLRLLTYNDLQKRLNGAPWPAKYWGNSYWMSIDDSDQKCSITDPSARKQELLAGGCYSLIGLAPGTAEGGVICGR